MYPHSIHPELKTNCAKLKQGQLLMQRYWATVKELTGGKWDHIAVSGREKSIILAKRMVEHAKKCPVCNKDRALADEDFYGVYPM